MRIRVRPEKTRQNQEDNEHFACICLPGGDPKEVGNDIILSEYENGGLIITGHGLYKVVRHVIGNLVRSDHLTERASAQYGMEDSR